MLNKEDTEIKATGIIFNKPGVVAHGKPLYEVVNLKTNERLYPLHRFQKEGELEYQCKTWVEENCRWPGDKEFSKNLLKKLTELESEEKLKEILVVENKTTYEGERHAEYKLVFKQGENYYSFNYFIGWTGDISLGRWMREDACNLGKKYLCRKVHPRKRVITRVEYVRNLEENLED